MIASIGQAIYLASRLRLRAAALPFDLEPESNPWFASVGAYRFSRGWKEPIMATSVGEWFEFLHQSGLKNASLFWNPHPLSSPQVPNVGFVGQDQWAVAVDLDRARTIWHLGFGRNPLQPIQPGELQLAGFALQPGQTSLTAELENAVNDLREVLAEATSFQQVHRPDEPFGEMWRSARLSLEGQSGLSEDSGRDPLPESYPPIAHRLVVAISRAWCFGGMGWWNDWRSSDAKTQDDFTYLSNRLYIAFAQGCVAAVNSFPTNL